MVITLMELQKSEFTAPVVTYIGICARKNEFGLAIDTSAEHVDRDHDDHAYYDKNRVINTVPRPVIDEDRSSTVFS